MARTRRLPALLALALATAGLLAACSSDDDASSTTTTAAVQDDGTDGGSTDGGGTDGGTDGGADAGDIPDSAIAEELERRAAAVGVINWTDEPDRLLLILDDDRDGVNRADACAEAETLDLDKPVFTLLEGTEEQCP